MNNSIRTLLLCLILPAFVTIQGQAQNSNDVEKGVRALAADMKRAFDARDLTAVMANYGKPEGLHVWGGTNHTLDSIKARIETVWSDRTNESWKQDKVDVLALSNNTALLQITWSGRYTLKSGAIWEYKSTSFSTYLVRKSGTTWKIVASHESGRGTQVNAAAKKQ
jgi:ketosteroid isomerase-like protein